MYKTQVPYLEIKCRLNLQVLNCVADINAVLRDKLQFIYAKQKEVRYREKPNNARLLIVGYPKS